MENRIKEKANLLFIILSGVFISSLVTCNLIFQKFFQLEIWIPFFGNYVFEQSVGLLAYPITFLVTDIISEVYGERKANEVITAGLFASLFMVFMVTIVDLMPSAEFGTGNIIVENPSNNKEQDIFHIVFGLSAAAVFASMMAYLIAQYIDVRIFHFWKRLTNGRHIWLRNNASTIFSQFVDTVTVISILCYFSVLPWNNFLLYIINGFSFKVFFAAFDTPIIYMLLYFIRKYFNLKLGQEIKL